MPLVRKRVSFINAGAAAIAVESLDIENLTVIGNKVHTWRRDMIWWRSPVSPATSLVIGNQSINDPGAELSLMSLAGSLPIMLGDPRKISAELSGQDLSRKGFQVVLNKEYDGCLFEIQRRP